jgi:hypothetical protein
LGGWLWFSSHRPNRRGHSRLGNGLSEISSGSYFEPYARYDISFAGDPTKRNISNLQLAPLFTLGLPETCFISLYPSADIRVNFGDPVTGQTGDARVGRKLNDHTALSFATCACAFLYAASLMRSSISASVG